MMDILGGCCYIPLFTPTITQSCVGFGFFKLGLYQTQSTNCESGDVGFLALLKA
jgi:hypothetical protein